MRTIEFDVPGWPGHRAGQHVDVRLTAEDGYQAERSYSIASPPSAGDRIALTVERLDDGEVSPYLVDEVRAGDHVELRGPIGGFFVWEIADGGPLFLVAGGSGIVPLMAMLRQRSASHSDVATRLLYSSRTLDDVIYRDELDALARSDPSLAVFHTLTRAQPPGWTGYSRRIDAAMLGACGFAPGDEALAYVCGPTPLAEAVGNALVNLGHAADRIRIERFGPTGG